MSRRVWKLPLSARQAAAFIKAAKAASFRSIVFEIGGMKITATDKATDEELRNEKSDWDVVLHDKN